MSAPLKLTCHLLKQNVSIFQPSILQEYVSFQGKKDLSQSYSVWICKTCLWHIGYLDCYFVDYFGSIWWSWAWVHFGSPRHDKVLRKKHVRFVRLRSKSQGFFVKCKFVEKNIYKRTDSNKKLATKSMTLELGISWNVLSEMFHLTWPQCRPPSLVLERVFFPSCVPIPRPP